MYELGRNDCAGTTYEVRKEIFFLQWYEILNAKTLKGDKIDKKYGCIIP